MLETIIIIALSSIILVLTSMLIWKRLNNNIVDYFNTLNIIKYFICVLLITINYIYMNDNIKTVVSTIIMILYYNSLYSGKQKNGVILPIYSQLIVLVSELVFAFIIIIFFKADANDILNTYFGSIFSNIAIAVIAIMISRFKIVSTLFNKITSITDKIKSIKLIIFLFTIIISANLLTAFVYYSVSLLYFLLVNTLIIIAYSIFIFFYIKTDNNYVKVYDKYNTTLNSLKEYENILSRYRISSHENKNQLLTIRGMIKNKKVLSYIDEIIENKLKDNERLMFESLVIPEGGLRGLIYSKMLLMDEKNIRYDLCVDKIIKTTDLTNISDDLMLNICNIIGVYLDNAIEAVENLNEKNIMIEIYLDDTLNIAITNNYEDNINFESIDKEGFSTKGNNHGYGLSLVKDIIDHNKNITNVKHISDDEFTQEIRIKYKK